MNEARLSALSFSLFLASVKVCNPTPPPGSDPLKLLVLDDVLIGMDLANRMPILKILENHFADYQTILITHDRVWFDLARAHLIEAR